MAEYETYDGTDGTITISEQSKCKVDVIIKDPNWNTIDISFALMPRRLTISG